MRMSTIIAPSQSRSRKKGLQYKLVCSNFENCLSMRNSELAACSWHSKVIIWQENKALARKQALLGYLRLCQGVSTNSLLTSDICSTGYTTVSVSKK